MKEKLNLKLICMVSLLGAALICAVVNFSNGFMGGPPTAVNITATIFFLLFWALMTQFYPAAKTSFFMSIYTLVTAIIGFCVAGEYLGAANIVISFVIFPCASLFYGLNFLQNFKLFYLIIALISSAIMLFSLITLVNKKPKAKPQPQPEETETDKTEAAEEAEQDEAPAETETSEDTAKTAEEVAETEQTEQQPEAGQDTSFIPVQTGVVPQETEEEGKEIIPSDAAVQQSCEFPIFCTEQPADTVNAQTAEADSQQDKPQTI